MGVAQGMGNDKETFVHSGNLGGSGNEKRTEHHEMYKIDSVYRVYLMGLVCSCWCRASIVSTIILSIRKFSKELV